MTKTLIIGDVHNDHLNLTRLLLEAGAIDTDTGQRAPGWRIVQVGDLIHGGTPEMGELATLDLAHMLRMEVLLGNHDAPHAYPDARFPSFAGQRPTGQLREMAIERLKQAGGYRQAATVVHGRLVTHAGLHPAVQAACHLHDLHDAQALADAINARLRARLRPGADDDPLFDWVGVARWGGEPHGGILWGDFRDLVPLPGIEQIVGHTPQDMVTHDNGAWNIDLGAALSGRLGGLVVSEDGKEWRPITVERPR